MIVLAPWILAARKLSTFATAHDVVSFLMFIRQELHVSGFSLRIVESQQRRIQSELFLEREIWLCEMWKNRNAAFGRNQVL
jgi:hypothetical protein